MVELTDGWMERDIYSITSANNQRQSEGKFTYLHMNPVMCFISTCYFWHRVYVVLLPSVTCLLSWSLSFPSSLSSYQFVLLFICIFLSLASFLSLSFCFTVSSSLFLSLHSSVWLSLYSFCLPLLFFYSVS